MFRTGTKPLSQTVGDGFGQTAHRDRTEFLSVVCLKAAVGNAAQCHGLIAARVLLPQNTALLLRRHRHSNRHRHELEGANFVHIADLTQLDHSDEARIGVE